jgi:hypothetical protein
VVGTKRERMESSSVDPFDGRAREIDHLPGALSRGKPACCQASTPPSSATTRV